MKYYYITNCPNTAKLAVQAKIQRIFLDCEVLGKRERQGHLDTLISSHSLQDVAVIKNAILNNAELLVRLNPCHINSAFEIDQAIKGGADIIMLPMFRSIEEINFFINSINNRAKFIPLVETKEAFALFENLCNIDAIDEIYIGLNDLTIDLKMHFIFEPLMHGMLDEVALLARQYNKPFGFGGISRIGDGAIPAEKVLGEHLRLGSTSVILSRAFHDNSSNFDDLIKKVDLVQEIMKLNNLENILLKRSLQQLEDDKNIFNNLVSKFIDSRIELHEKIF